MNIECPLPTALVSVPRPTCPFRFDQIVMLILFQRGGPTFANADALKLQATWTPLLAAADDTKVVTTPIFSGFVIPSSEALTAGGNDNTTFNGIPDYFGEGSVTVTGNFKNLPGVTIDGMRNWTQYSIPSAAGVSQLEAMMVNKDGYIFYRGGAAATDVYGFSWYNWRVASTGSEGFNSHNLIPFGGTLPPEWDKNLSSVKASFDILSMVNP